MIALADNDASNIKGIVRSDSLASGLTSDNVVSENDSVKPVYMWFVEDDITNDGTGSIYWYSEADFINETSTSEMFKDLSTDCEGERR